MNKYQADFIVNPQLKDAAKTQNFAKTNLFKTNDLDSLVVPPTAAV